MNAVATFRLQLTGIDTAGVEKFIPFKGGVVLVYPERIDVVRFSRFGLKTRDLVPTGIGQVTWLDLHSKTRTLSFSSFGKHTRLKGDVATLRPLHSLLVQRTVPPTVADSCWVGETKLNRF